LIDLAPIIRSSDESCRSIELGGYLRANESIFLTFRAIYRAPGHLAVLIRDGADGTPLFLAADRKMLLYDPLRSVLLWKEDNNVHFSLTKEGDALRIHLDVTTDKDRPSNALVDVKSLVAGQFMNDKVVRIGDRQYRLTRTTEKGNALECAIDLDRYPTYANIKIIHDKQREPCLLIDVLRENVNIDNSEFFFPKREELAGKTCLRDLPGGAVTGNGGELTVLMRACYARAAIIKPALREAIGRSEFPDIDWKHVEENDKKISHELREALTMTSQRK
jgi:hypothetical protein